MDQQKGVTPRWSKRYLRSGIATSKDEARYLLDDDHDAEDYDVVVSSSLRGRKARDEGLEADDVLISVPGRPPTRPPNDQCVEAEIQPDDTLASISLKYNVPVAELKRVNRLLNEKDFFAKTHVKIPVKPASLLTEILPFSKEAKTPSNFDKAHQSAILDLSSDNSLSESSDYLAAPTPEVRRAQRLLHKIDDDVRMISKRQEDLRQDLNSSAALGNPDLEILSSDSGKQDSWLDRLNTNKKWVVFYGVIVIVAFVTVWMLTKYERGLLTHNDNSIHATQEKLKSADSPSNLNRVGNSQ